MQIYLLQGCPFFIGYNNKLTINCLTKYYFIQKINNQISKHNILKMSLNVPKHPQCPLHSLPIISTCCKTNCTFPMPICQFCQQNHLEHTDKLIPFDNFSNSIAYALNNQNARDVEVLKENNALNFKINQIKKDFQNREKKVIENLMKKLEFEKNIILRSTKNDQIKENTKIPKYFDLLSQKNLVAYRLMFSSQKGLDEFYRSYKKYCQISDISCHLKQSQIPQEQQVNQKLEQSIKKSLTGTLTQNVMNFIKIKISKKDAMKVSIAAFGMNSMAKPKNVGMPPLSPQKKQKRIGKTQLNF